VAAAALGQPLGLLLRVPAPVILAAAFGGLAIALRASLVASLRARRQARQYALVQTLEATLGAIAILGLAALGSLTYEAAILSLLGATSVIAVVALGLWANDPGLRVQRRLVIPLLAFSLPMVLHGLATYGLGAYGQIVVNLLLGPVDAGRFAYAYRFGMAMLIVATAFSAAWLPAFLESMRTESGRLGLARRALLYWASMVAVAVAFMIVLPWIAVVLGGPEYAAGARLVPLVVYAYVWHVAYTMVLGFHLEAGRTPLLALGTVVALAIGVALTLFLITTVGLVGAAVGAIGAYASLFAVQLAMTQLSERGRVLEIDYRPIAATALAVGLIPAALSLLGYPG
jgi:O-antigen/teichoic acid export membrane protein